MHTSPISQESLIEAPSRMEPLFLDEMSLSLADTSAAVAQAVATMGGNLPAQTLHSLAKLLRLMNCYYSNLIEGHRTRPHDIEAALRQGGTQSTSKKPSDPSGERVLQLALAHIECQMWIEGLYSNGQLPNPASVDFISAVHKRFYQELPVEFLEIRDKHNNDVVRVMVPGQMRGVDQDVIVGEHQPPSGGDATQAFIQRYEEAYSTLRGKQLGIAQKLCGIAAAHHRLLFIHPFDDGNGRVARLVTHAMMLDAGLGASGLWSMSRGLARGLRHNAPIKPKALKRLEAVSEVDQYKKMMMLADQKRYNDLDGRGNLSRKSLQDFCEWFLSIAVDQITFMASEFRLSEIETRLVKYYIPRRRLDERAGKILTEVARLGELQRSSIKVLLGVSARTATNITASLIADGIIASQSSKDALRINFGPDSAEILFPGLFSLEALSPSDEMGTVVVKKD